jgi:hypothetical protein
MCNHVAVGYERGDEEGDENREYQDKGNHRREKPKYSDPSTEDMLHGPCRIHYAYLDGKRVCAKILENRRFSFESQNVASIQEIFLQCALICQFWPIDIEPDNSGPPVRLRCQGGTTAVRSH